MRWSVLLLGWFGSLLALTGCPSSAPSPSDLPSCDTSHHDDDCVRQAMASTGVRATLKFCLPLGNPGQGRCVACRNSRDCDDGHWCNGVEQCDIFLGCMPGSPPIVCPSCFQCNETMRVCRDEGTHDDDGDGHRSISCGGDDCDDSDANRYPGNTEVCDTTNHDEDCDPRTFGRRDGDNDGWYDARCCNTDGSTQYCGDDCDDNRMDIHPALDEACDGVDNDCDGVVDETVTASLYTDADGDGWGVGDAHQMCTGRKGYAFQAGDCDDANPQLHPGAFRCAGSGSAIDVCGDAGAWSESTCPGDGQCVAQPDGTGVCWPGTLTECTDGVDNDGDGLVDSEDPDCTSPTDATERPERCGDGIDNDGDHLTDYPNDPGCSSPEDTDEADPATLPACSNGMDDDGDGTQDFRMGSGDPGCSSAADDSERNPSGPQCDNGIDDDADTHTDFPDDPECSGPLDNNEGTPACNNGIDDDGDGLKDFVVGSNFNDPGCTDAKDDDERGTPPGAPVCDNGLDDDGDGAADYPGDRGCTGPADTSE